MTFFEEAEPEMEQTHPPKFSSAKPEAPPGREKDAGPRRAPIGSQSVKAGRREGRPCRKKETAQKKKRRTRGFLRARKPLCKEHFRNRAVRKTSRPDKSQQDGGRHQQDGKPYLKPAPCKNLKRRAHAFPALRERPGEAL